MNTPVRGRNVLLIEDNPDLREVTARLLRMMDCTVTTAENGQQGLYLLRKMKELPCLIFLDLTMPVMDGWTFLEEKQKDADLAAVPVVVVSAVVDKSTVISNVVACLQKPVNCAQLARSIAENCPHRQYEADPF